jgi:FHS family L-fucose permease-like MFS transporter
MMTSRKSATSAFAAVTALFFGWGFVTSLVDPLVAAVKNIFSLTNVEAQLSAFAFFIAYGVVSLPAALLARRLRSTTSIILALGLMVAGCLSILFASNIAVYPVVLIGLFILASGVTILQVAANPLAAVLGPPERSHFRLTFSQAFNSLGTILGPLLGASLLLDGIETAPGEVLDDAARANALAAIDTAFVGIALLIALIGLFIWLMRHRILAAAPPTGSSQSAADMIREAFASRWTLLGGGAIFLYVGAEVSIGTQMALFLHDASVWDVPLQRAGYFVSLYWLGAMVGRFIGSGLMISTPASRLLTIATAAAAVLCVTVFLLGGEIGGYAALSIGLFNSIMFPTIFTLTLERSTASKEVTSGFLCTAIVGGAFLPLLAGAISDAMSYERSFIIPALCYACLSGFAVLAARTRPNSHGSDGSRVTLSH